jgi:hypothetical protein
MFALHLLFKSSYENVDILQAFLVQVFINIVCGTSSKKMYDETVFIET